MRSFKPAATRHHFINGAQKNTVFGPVRPPPPVQAQTRACAPPRTKLTGRSDEREPGQFRQKQLDQDERRRVTSPAGWFINAWNLEAPAEAAVPDIVQRCSVGLGGWSLVWGMRSVQRVCYCLSDHGHGGRSESNVGHRWLLHDFAELTMLSPTGVSSSTHSAPAPVCPISPACLHPIHPDSFVSRPKVSCNHLQRSNESMSEGVSVGHDSVSPLILRSLRVSHWLQSEAIAPSRAAGAPPRQESGRTKSIL